MPGLDDVARLLRQESGLATVSTTQGDGRVLSSVANCAVVAHPVTGEPRVALVSLGGAARLGHVRRGSQVTVLVRRGWSWTAVTGPADLVGPDDPSAGLDADRVRLLLREIFVAAGGGHEDWDAYDRVMAEERRTAVLVRPDRVLGQLPGG